MTIFVLAIPSFSAFAEVTGEPVAYDYYISDEDFEKLEHVDSENNNITTYSSGIIESKTLSLAKDGNNLIIKASTKTIDAKKSGFTYIKLQQYKNGKWVDYKIFNDLYGESNRYSVTKSISAEKGYKYRVIAQHYAKKSLFSVEKIYNETTSLSF